MVINSTEIVFSCIFINCFTVYLSNNLDEWPGPCKGLEPATFWLPALELAMTPHHPSYVFANMSQNPNMAGIFL